MIAGNFFVAVSDFFGSCLSAFN